jgi:hypothetical protein
VVGFGPRFRLVRSLRGAAGENCRRDPSGSGACVGAGGWHGFGWVDCCGKASPALERSTEDLGEEPSPWKERVSLRWQRWSGATDSSMEQSLEVGCSR